MPCKGICIRYKTPSNHYTNGHKRCKECELFIKWDGVLCPCCGHKLRTRPRNFSKVKLREKRAIDEAKGIKIISHSYNRL
jgi:uncharacterized Zn finger protein (UPF0148 family)